MPLPPFVEVARVRPVALVQPGTSLVGGAPAPYAAATGPAPTLRSLPGREPVALRAVRAGRRVALEVERDGATRRLVSARHGWVGAVDKLAVTLTGPVATAWSGVDGTWTARAQTRVGLGAAWRHLGAGDGTTTSGRFGQLGLRDVRLVTEADGSPVREAPGAPYLFTATSAGPAGFRTGHTSVWALDAGTLALTHRADLYFRRDGRVVGDHATHLVRDGGAWLVATSTWGTFDPDRRPGVWVQTGLSLADLTRGAHVLDTEPLALPVGDLASAGGSVGTWDPHLVHDGGRWLVAFASARRFFSFHPAVAAGPRLEDLTLLGAAGDRVFCEGPTLARLDEGWRLLASDGREEDASRAAGYPVMDLACTDVGRLEATYPTNLPWPTVVPHDGGWLMVGFDGTPYGGRLVGYGSHGDVVVQRTAAPPAPQVLSSSSNWRVAAGPSATSSGLGAAGAPTGRSTPERSMS